GQERLTQEWNKAVEKAIDEHWFGNLGRTDFRTPPTPDSLDSRADLDQDGPLGAATRSFATLDPLDPRLLDPTGSPDPRRPGGFPGDDDARSIASRDDDASSLYSEESADSWTPLLPHESTDSLGTETRDEDRPPHWDDAFRHLVDTLPLRLSHEAALQFTLNRSAGEFHDILGHPDSLTHRYEVTEETVERLGKDFREETVTRYDEIWAAFEHDTEAWLKHEAKHENAFQDTLAAAQAGPLETGPQSAIRRPGGGDDTDTRPGDADNRPDTEGRPDAEGRSENQVTAEDRTDTASDGPIRFVTSSEPTLRGTVGEGDEGARGTADQLFAVLNERPRTDTPRTDSLPHEPLPQPDRSTVSDRSETADHADQLAHVEEQAPSDQGTGTGRDTSTRDVTAGGDDPTAQEQALSRYDEALHDLARNQEQLDLLDSTRGQGEESADDLTLAAAQHRVFETETQMLGTLDSLSESGVDLPLPQHLTPGATSRPPLPQRLHQHPAGPAEIYPPQPRPVVKQDTLSLLPTRPGDVNTLADALNHVGPIAGLRLDTVSGVLTSDLDPLTLADVAGPLSKALTDKAGQNLQQYLHDTESVQRPQPSSQLWREHVARQDYRTESYWASQDERLAAVDEEVGARATQIPPRLSDEQLTQVDHLVSDLPAGLAAQQILEHHEGFVLGESHTASNSWPYLVRNMPLLAQQGVRTLYLEALRDDSYQQLLDEYNRSELGAEMPTELARAIDRYDAAFNSAGTGVGLRTTVETAKSWGIRVVAIDGFPARSLDTGPWAYHERAARFNLYATDAWAQDRRWHGGRWVMVVGSAHVHQHTATVTPPAASTLPTTVPGVSDWIPVPALELVFDPLTERHVLQRSTPRLSTAGTQDVLSTQVPYELTTFSEGHGPSISAAQEQQVAGHDSSDQEEADLPPQLGRDKGKARATDADLDAEGTASDEVRGAPVEDVMNGVHVARDQALSPVSIWLPASEGDRPGVEEGTAGALAGLAEKGNHVFVFGEVRDGRLFFRGQPVTPAALAGVITSVAPDRLPLLAMRDG
ncbi:membrane-targeted effector domain-containing toxin, partial [Streptomyces sp.]|uniref:membrane-targeted effector domain-containing toxin n=1 Tax=Streptomyces sp. TaxID=1931 RepID=UPI002F40E3F9